jgi:hypothetical protein
MGTLWAGWIIWTAAAMLYLLFRLWYDGRHRRLSAAEIDAFLTEATPRFAETGNDPAILRAFLEADDGREFVMLNMVKVAPGQVRDPATGQMVAGAAMLQRYASRFRSVLLRSGGHPVMVGRKVGGYIDAWNCPADPGWTLFGLMRYRSRRDMIRLAAHPDFLAAHPEKLLGTPMTFSFPTQPMLSLYASPRVTVGLALALAAALLHLAFEIAQ